MQIELDARAVLQHLEANGVLAADDLLLRIDADIEMVGEQIVVDAVRPIRAAQNVRARHGAALAPAACGRRQRVAK